MYLYRADSQIPCIEICQAHQLIISSSKEIPTKIYILQVNQLITHCWKSST